MDEAWTVMPDGDIYWLCPTCDHGDCVGSPKCYTVDEIGKLRAVLADIRGRLSVPAYQIMDTGSCVAIINAILGEPGDRSPV